MLQIFMSQNQQLVEIKKPESGSWISLTNPSEEELQFVENELGAKPHLLRAAMDSEESPHIDREGDQLLIIVDAVMKDDSNQVFYITIPVGIVMLKNYFITICLSEDTILEDFKRNNIKDFYTQFKTRFLLQILYRNASRYLTSLKVLDKLTTRLERDLQNSLRNKELLEMLKIEKSLVYFSTSLRSNETVLERLLRHDQIKNYPEDADILDDVITENKQAIDMCSVYVTILTSTMDAYASVISNNQNNVMKVLTSVTIVMAVPSIIGALWGMNVPLPLENHPMGFLIIVALNIIVMVAILLILKKIKML